MQPAFYTPARSRQQARSAEARDMARQRDRLAAAIALGPGERLLDVGCSSGKFLEEIAAAGADPADLAGIDAEESAIRAAAAALPAADLRVADATALPYPDGAFHAAVTAQVLCYIEDLDAALAEIARVLRPGGRAVILDTDWDTMAWNTRAPDLMARARERLLRPLVHRDVPRGLVRRLERAGFADAAVDTLTFVSTERDPGTYAQISEDWVVALLGEDPAFSEDDIAAFEADQAGLDADGAYFFSVTRFIFTAKRAA